VAVVPNVLVVPSSLPARSVKEFIALAKAQPGKLAYGSTGNGTAHHLIGEQFNDMAGTRLLHIPYKGSAPALTDLMGGQIQAMFDTVASCLPHIQSGKLRALAVATAKRSVALPEVPTMAESGLAGFNIASWFGLMAPAGTPPGIVAKVQKEVARLLLRNARQSLDTEPGCRQFDVCRWPDDECRFLLYEIYDDAQAFQAHLAADHFKAFDAAVTPWLSAKSVQLLQRLAS
jgi:tripartite-type tricarboxylate transporter receptor subunit TctC